MLVPERKGASHDVKTYVTLELDSELLREARVRAGEQGVSISALPAERVESMVRERKAFDKARRRALAPRPYVQRRMTGA